MEQEMKVTRLGVMQVGFEGREFSVSSGAVPQKLWNGSNVVNEVKRRLGNFRITPDIWDNWRRSNRYSPYCSFVWRVQIGISGNLKHDTQEMLDALTVQQDGMHPVRDWIQANWETFQSLGVNFVCSRNVLKNCFLRTREEMTNVKVVHKFGVTCLQSTNAPRNDNRTTMTGEEFENVFVPLQGQGKSKMYGIFLLEITNMKILYSAELDVLCGNEILELKTMPVHAETSTIFQSRVKSIFLQSKLSGCENLVIGKFEQRQISSVELWNTQQIENDLGTEVGNMTSNAIQTLRAFAQ